MRPTPQPTHRAKARQRAADKRTRRRRPMNAQESPRPMNARDRGAEDRA